MMSPGERGKRTFLTFRRGVKNFPGWGGMRLYNDPSQLANYLRRVENGRPRFGNWVRRPGYEQLNTEPVHSVDAHFNWLSSVQTNPLRIYAAAGGCTGVDSVGFSLTWFDIDQEPRLQSSTYYADIDQLQLGLFDNRIYVGLSHFSPRSSDLRRYETVVTSWGTDQLDIAGTKQEYPLYTFALRTIEWLEPFDNKLFISLDDGTTGGAADNRVAVYDGLSIFDGSTTAMPADREDMDFPVTVMGKARDFLVAGYAAGANMLSFRDPGEVPGTWHDVTPMAGTIVSRRMAEYKNKLYVVPGGIGADATNIWLWDDTDPATFAATTVAIVRTIANSRITACCVFNGYLYYGWLRTTDSHAIIGRYDGTTWTDVHKDLSAQADDAGSEPFLLQHIDDLIEYRGSLYAAVFSDIDASPIVNTGIYLVYSTAGDTDGDWTVQNRAAVTNAVPPPATHGNDRSLFISPATGGVVRRLLVA